MGGYLAASLSLTTLSLCDNDLGDEGVEALSLRLKQSKSLTKLDLSNHVSRSVKFGPRGTVALAAALADSTSLAVLSLTSNHPGKIEVKATEVQGASLNRGDKAVHQGRAITVVREKDGDGMIEIFEPNGVLALADALLVNRSLTRLCISQEPLKDFGTEACKALECALRFRSGEGFAP